jgi:hypothetical protein
MLRYLKGEANEIQYQEPQPVTADLPGGSRIVEMSAEREEPYGYCTNFLLEGHKLNPDKIRKKLESKGQSLVVVGDEHIIRVHIHTYDPGGIIQYATVLGTLHQLQIQNMDDQHVGFMEMQHEKQQPLDIAVVAVAAGSGMKEVFKSLGSAAVVFGGQTMNPSVQEILEAVDAVPSQRVIVLPNNKNIVLTASQVQALTAKEVVIIPTKTVPQGIAALIAYSYEGTLEENRKLMEDALASVKTVEVTRAVRDVQINGLKIEKGQAIGIIDDKDIVAAGNGDTEVLFEAIGKACADSVRVVTIYYGADVGAPQAEQVAQKMRDMYLGRQVETVFGNQPHYSYIVSLE